MMREYIVEIEQGAISGRKKDNLYYSFKGIPYAKPPLGALRFKAPQPPDYWKGIRDCSQDGPECYSRNQITRLPSGSEDCLILNVYTPKIGTGIPLPVMFYIHGGGFTSGSNNSQIYGPDFLLEEQIVLVTINYRLGALGFLCLQDSSAGVPGNAGLKDMVMALKWVRRNIHKFDGDPENITIFGESAGGAAVHHLILSPMAKGLFHRAIAQSGCALNPWVPGRRTNAEEMVKFLPEYSPNLNDHHRLKLLQELPVEKLFEISEKIQNTFVVSRIRPFGPIVESSSKIESAFLSQHPIDIIKSGDFTKVPFLLGFVNREGMLIEAVAGKGFRQTILKNFELSVPHFLNLQPRSAISLQVARKIKNFYYGPDTKFYEDLDRYYLLGGDNFFIRDILNTAKYHLKYSTEPIYLYRISVESSLNTFKRISNITGPGVCHADDLGYLFKTIATPEFEPNSLEDISVKRFVKFWTNFAKYGDPNPQTLDDTYLTKKWEAIQDPNHLHYLNIGPDLSVGTNPENDRMQFWDSILDINPVYCKL